MTESLLHAFVEIPVEGDWPSAEDMEARNAIIDELDQLKIGEFIGAGGGLGAMDFSYHVADEQRARQAIHAAVLKYLPNREFNVDISHAEQAANTAADGIPTSRCYVHKKCGEATEVGGGDFKNIACPAPGMHGTMCAPCGQMFPIAEFKWEDSGEDIVKYYERYRGQLPSSIKLACSRKVSLVTLLAGFLAGIGVGIWLGTVLGVIWGIVLGFVLSIVGAIATMIVWDNMTTRWLCKALGVTDVRSLK